MGLSPFHLCFCHSHIIIVLWCIDSLLGKDLETNNETTAVAIQRCGKSTSTAIELLLETVFSTWSVQRGYKEDNWSDQVQVKVGL
jgi:hypothetical protein